MMRVFPYGTQVISTRRFRATLKGGRHSCDLETPAHRRHKRRSLFRWKNADSKMLSARKKQARDQRRARHGRRPRSDDAVDGNIAEMLPEVADEAHARGAPNLVLGP